MSDLISSDLDADLKNSWGTDPVIFNALNKEFNFELDAAASALNNLVTPFITKEMDALALDWKQQIDDFYGPLLRKNYTVWVNPPYGNGFIKQFMQKAIEEKAKGVTTVLLVPATLDAQWLPIQDISEIRIVTGGRLSFYHPITNKKINGNTKGSMFVVFRPTSMPCCIRLVDRNELLVQGEE
ncbi:phage N-6-adenine-methyltransferase [Psychrosphaera sp. 1_MG-2023]|uniref:phage N-6-adenine-methyltransferase n=1 Tax=Psychrosphaera sp. 1_MG-2023 TaxID=3062643 RepID=UPI0026E4285C|nr:phage N-6-adenine-methyltransferase [Psychrosphaera sp. 1_MG-2023]MDO6718847.1 phage N-6-adenine-methyltransferase [Psychrosphaera sp. 1_MG-2023]